MKRLIAVLFAAAIAAAPALPAHAAGEGLAGFNTVEPRVAVPTAGQTPCSLDSKVLLKRMAGKLLAAGIQLGTSALTLRARVSTLSDAIANRCISAVELVAFTAQTTVIQATRNSMVAEIPLWSSTSIATSDAKGHNERVGATVAILAEKFAAAYKANR